MSSAGLLVCRMCTPFLEAGLFGKRVCAWLHEQDEDPRSVLHLKAVLSTVREKPFKQHLEPKIIANINNMLKPVLPPLLPNPRRPDRQITLWHKALPAANNAGLAHVLFNLHAPCCSAG